MEFRAPTTDDVEALAKVHVRCWQETYAGLMDQQFLNDLSVAGRAEGWRKTLSDSEVFARLACQDDAIAGFVSAGPSRSPADADGEVYAIYVLRAFQGRGIGRCLFGMAADNWRKHGGTSLLVSVITGNKPAIGFYAAMGGEKLRQEEITRGGMVLDEDVMRFDLSHPARKP